MDDTVLKDMAEQLLGAMTSDIEVDDSLLSTAENLISTHHLYIQLLFVSLLMDRARNINLYFEAMDAFCEDLSVEDVSEMTPGEKTNAMRAITTSVKSQLEVVNSMLATKEASGVLIASLRDEFGRKEVEVKDEDNVLGDIQSMKPEQRQRVLRGTVQALRELARKESEKG